MMKSAGFRLLLSSVLLCAASALPVAAQAPAFDTSGNGMLTGTYYFRHVIYSLSSSASQSTGISGDINEAIALYGNISFDGNGNYSITGGIVSDSDVGATVPLSCYLAGESSCATSAPVAGTYAISSSGLGYLANPIVSGDYIYGLVAANGIFSGSSTETSYSYNDLFIGAPLPSPLPTAASFNGSWTVMGYFPDGDLNFQIAPNGSNSLGTVNVLGYVEGNGSSVISQSAAATYTFSNGAAVVTFPNNGTLLFGQEFYYFSPDGNFFFGGSPADGYDMIVGVRNPSGTQNFSGLYYQAGIDQDTSEITSTGVTYFDSYYGSLNAIASGSNSGNILMQQRLSGLEIGTYGQTFDDTFSPPVTGSYVDTGTATAYTVADGGAIRIGQGQGPYLGLTVAFAAPTFTPTSSVYINPTGVVNAASFAPFTSGVSDGEFITIFGNNLAPSTTVASGVPYPTTLAGVQVTINSVPVPIYYVSPTQIAVIVPGEDPYMLANIQVTNNGSASNTVSSLKFVTTPGIYTLPSGGLGYAAAVHVNGQVVTTSNPAAPSETIEVFTTGLGQVYPPVADGAAPPTSPLSYTTNTITADVSGTTATVTFAGAAPELAGLYQVNVTVPSTLASSDSYTIDLSGPDSYNFQALLPVGTSPGSASARPAIVSSARTAMKAPRHATQRKPCFPGKTACGAASGSHIR